MEEKAAAKAKRSLAMGLVGLGALLVIVALGAYAYKTLSSETRTANASRHTPKAARVAAERAARKKLELEGMYAAIRAYEANHPRNPAATAAAAHADAARIYAAYAASHPSVSAPTIPIVPATLGSQFNASAAPAGGRHRGGGRTHRHARTRHRVGVGG